jgi:hypothetical protein
VTLARTWAACENPVVCRRSRSGCRGIALFPSTAQRLRRMVQAFPTAELPAANDDAEVDTESRRTTQQFGLVGGGCDYKTAREYGLGFFCCRGIAAGGEKRCWTVARFNETDPTSRKQRAKAPATDCLFRQNTLMAWSEPSRVILGPSVEYRSLPPPLGPLRGRAAASLSPRGFHVQPP